jgi:hypothetical protein
VIAWEAATNAQVLVAGATFLLAAVTAWMASATRTMSAAALEATAQAQRATDAALEEVAEIVRGRVDAMGPAVSLIVDPSIEANVLRQRGPLPQDGGFYLLDSTLRHSSEVCSIGDEFMFPRDSGQYLLFIVPCHLHNEGITSVRVTIHNEALFLPHLPDQRPSNPAVMVLQPGQSVSFHWAAGHTLAEWADGREDRDGVANPNRHLRLNVMVEDLRRSVIDYFFAEVGGTPIEPAPEATGLWRVETTQVHGPVYPTQRWYRHENNPYPSPPWS